MCIHTWATWLDDTSDTLYAVTGSQMAPGNEPVADWEWSGEVFSSIDDGANWTRLANRDGSQLAGYSGDSVGNYRTYDIVEFDGKLVITWTDFYLENPADPDSLTYACGLAQSSDGGKSWTRLTDVNTNTTACRQRLHVFDNQLLALTSAGTGLRALQPDGTILTYAFPGFEAADFAYHVMADDGTWLYVLGDNGRILRTTDLTNWQTLESTDREFITIGYWPLHDKVVVADRGSDARLWQFDAASAVPNPPPAHTPVVAIGLDGDAVQLNWDASASPGDQYRVYRGSDLDFDRASHTSNLIATTATADLLDNNLNGADVVGDVDVNYYYLVRTEDAGGILSTKSNKVGVFDFAIVAGE